MFIDAAVTLEEWSLRRLSLGEHFAPLNYVSHVLTPEELLELEESLYGKRKEAWVLSVKGEDFSFGTGITLKTRLLAEEAEKLLEKLIEVKLENA